MFKTRDCGEGKNGKPVIEEKGTAKDVSNAAKSFIFSHSLYNPDKHQRPHPPGHTFLSGQRELVTSPLVTDQLIVRKVVRYVSPSHGFSYNKFLL